MPPWTLDDICKELKDGALFLGHKKAGLQSPGEGVKDLEASLVKGILSKLKCLQLTAATSLVLYKVLDHECDSFSKDLKDQIKKEIDSLLTQPPPEASAQLSLKPQQIVLPPYLTEQDWSTLRGAGTSKNEKFIVLVTRLVALGIKSMHEQTVASVVACYFTTLATLPDPEERLKTANDIKLAFASMSSQERTVPYIHIYPKDPKQLAPDVLSQAYVSGDGPHMFTPDQYHLVLKRAILRKSHSEIKNEKAISLPVNQPPPAPVSSAPPTLHLPPANSAPVSVSGPEMFMMMFNCMKAMSNGSPPRRGSISAEPSRPALPPPAPPAEPVQPLPIADLVPFTPKLRTSIAKGESKESHLQEESQEKNESQEADESAALANGKAIETAAFEALKARKGNAAKGSHGPKPKGKAKAKGKAAPKAASKKAATPKGKSMKRPASKMSQVFVAANFEYKCGEPEARWQGKYQSWVDKHYHKAKDLATGAGADPEMAKELGRKARTEAKDAYLKVFG